MSLVALTNFITITNPNGSVANIPDKFQNGRHSHPTEKNKIDGFQYLSFIYQGAARNRSGDNMTSSLLLANNELSMNYAQQIVLNKYHVKVETWLMTEAFQRSKQLTEEQWLASSMSYDPEAIEIILSSAIDAVGANAPDKVLTRDIVGALPITGSIQNR